MRTASFTRSFIRLYRKLAEEKKEAVDEAIEELLKSLDGGPMTKGLGVKKLTEGAWEMRVDLSLRVGFSISYERVEFSMVGDHDAIRKYLKNL